MSKTLTHIYPKDIRALSCVARCGAIDSDGFHQMEISNNRIQSYRKCGLIRSHLVPNPYGANSKCYYELTKKGKEWCLNHCKDITKTSFISNGNSTRHNGELANYVSSNLTKKELDNMLCERELKGFIEDRLQEYYDRNDERYEQLLDRLKEHTLSMPDIVYVKETTTNIETYIAIECITSNYSQEEIDMKIETCEVLGIELTLIRA